MILVHFLLVLLPLLTEHVQAADNFFGGNRNWNLRRPIALNPRSNPPPTTTEAIISDIAYDTPPEIIVDNSRVAPRPNYRLIPQPNRFLTSRPQTVATVTQPSTTPIVTTTIKYEEPEPTTTSSPPEPPLSRLDERDERVSRNEKPSSNPSFGRALLPRPNPTTWQPVVTTEIPTTVVPTTKAPILEEAPKVVPVEAPKAVFIPTTTTIEPPSTTTAEIPIVVTPEEVVIENPVISLEDIEVIPKEVEAPKPVVDESIFRSRPSIGYSRRPDIGGRPSKVPTPVPRPIPPKQIITKPAPSVIPPSDKGRSLIPSNPGPVWTTAAPTQLFDYKCGSSYGYYSIEGDCDNYVECKKNIAIMYTCPDGLHYNPKTQWPDYPCSYPSEVQCEYNSVRQLVQPTDECPQQYGFFSMPDDDCSKYIMCREGKAYVMNCPAGLAFSLAASMCDWPENVPSCKPNVFRGFTCPAPKEDEDGNYSNFIHNYRYGDSCKEYVACLHGQPRLLRCDPGLSFDEESQVCVDSDYVSNCKRSN